MKWKLIFPNAVNISITKEQIQGSTDDKFIQKGLFHIVRNFIVYNIMHVLYVGTTFKKTVSDSRMKCHII
jgi:hypothetical protein